MVAFKSLWHRRWSFARVILQILFFAAFISTAIDRIMPVSGYFSWITYLPYHPVAGITTPIYKPLLLSILFEGVAALVISLAVIGFFFLFAATLGRAGCGWLCPEGFIIDLANFMRRRRDLLSHSTEKDISWLKYFFVIMMFVSSIGEAALLAMGEITYKSQLHDFNSGLRASTSPVTSIIYWMLDGSMYNSLMETDFNIRMMVIIRIAIFVVLLLVAGKYGRIWCKHICPVGILTGLIGRFSLIGLKISPARCTRCGLCERICPTDVKILSKNFEDIRDKYCILCMRCVESCPENALRARVVL
ncbi:MAG: 4Fe-4S binding protein [Candidatus Korarchaeota archaeon]